VKKTVPAAKTAVAPVAPAAQASPGETFQTLDSAPGQ
jgi:hypothetical protein